MMPHHCPKPAMTLLTPAVTRSKMIRPNIAPLKEQLHNTKMEQIKPSRTTRNIYRAQGPIALLHRQSVRWRKMRGAGTEFLMKPMTCWTGCWTWTLLPGSQLLRPCSTHCSQAWKLQTLTRAADSHHHNRNCWLLWLLSGLNKLRDVKI